MRAKISPWGVGGWWACMHATTCVSWHPPLPTMMRDRIIDVLVQHKARCNILGLWLVGPKPNALNAVCFEHVDTAATIACGGVWTAPHGLFHILLAHTSLSDIGVTLLHLQRVSVCVCVCVC